MALLLARRPAGWANDGENRGRGCPSAYARAVPRLPTVLLLLLVPALVAACSSDPSELDLAKAEGKIRDLVVQAYGDEVEVGSVRCPDKVVQEQGDTFTCTAEVDDQDLAFGVRQTDGVGNVRIRVLEAVISNAKAERFVSSYATRKGTPVSAVSCGTGRISVRLPGERITCTVTYESGGRGLARLQVGSVTGKIGLQSLSPSS